MSVTASMWTAVSGLLAHGEKMNVIGNNISNVNTTAFKSQRMDFADFVYQDMPSSNGLSQVGRGTMISSIFGDFSQGSQEASNTVTDISINGTGFFKVRNPSSVDDTFYTRAGNFRFNKDGEMVAPNGYILQGWEIARTKPSIASTATVSSPTSAIKGSGVPKDITLDTFTCQPQHTQSISIIDRLSTDGGDKCINAADPFFAMLLAWDATNPALNPPLGDSLFTHQTTLTVYDEAGAKHNLTIYFDKVENIPADQPITNWDTAEQQWEFIVTMDPLEDVRSFNGVDVTNASRGLLMSGTLTMTTSGLLKDMTAYVPSGAAANTGNLHNLDNWVPAPLSNEGKPMLVANFSGITGASSIFQADNSTINPLADPFMMQIDFGITSKTRAWSGLTPGDTAGDVGNDLSNLFSMAPINSAGSTTIAVSGTSTSQTFQDGYGFGYLQNVLISTDGVLSARYDNGVTLDLYQITLYNFMNEQGLYREGGNMFMETRESGSPMEGAAGMSGLGKVYSNSLEMSNVDLAKEFVYMIATQRGFQSNSKTITTVDTMLEYVVNMKR